MFKFFRKNKIQVPENYKNFISQSDYNVFIHQVLSVLQDLGVQVESFENGDIAYRGKNNLESHYYLDNLIRLYVQADPKDKLSEITNHFRKLQESPHVYEYLFKDYDYAKQFLKVLIKPLDIAPNIDDFVTREDYPDLLTMLVLDYEERFHFIKKRKQIFGKWNMKTYSKLHYKILVKKVLM
ncbi:MAG: hypothetical protein HC831_14820 [Chloroflexia bacterium]|nr:hypothetical protein [Chloroflexia bacterium]